jgi:imidazolonepropionase-like amidohydrolase
MAPAIADEIALLASPGLAPARAIAAVASSTARAYLGRPGLVIGSPADVVTCYDDQRSDLEVLRHPAAVVRSGRRVR